MVLPRSSAQVVLLLQLVAVAVFTANATYNSADLTTEATQDGTSKFAGDYWTFTCSKAVVDGDKAVVGAIESALKTLSIETPTSNGYKFSQPVDGEQSETVYGQGYCGSEYPESQCGECLQHIANRYRTKQGCSRVRAGMRANILDGKILSQFNIKAVKCALRYEKYEFDDGLAV